MSSANIANNDILYSAWTPLSNPSSDTRNKLIRERSNLIIKWFTKWPSNNKIELVKDLTLLCNVKEQQQIFNILDRTIPKMHCDFTRYLPRILSLYILSFLDPRSLCRTAQVSWHWKNLSESNSIWINKCLKLGWAPPNIYIEPPLGFYKKLYVNNMQYLRIDRPLEVMAQHELARREMAAKEAHEKSIAKRTVKKKSRDEMRKDENKLQMSPWRCPTRHPKDIRRFNYLVNEASTNALVTARSTEYLSLKKSSSFQSRPQSAIPLAHQRPSGTHGQFDPFSSTNRQSIKKSSIVATSVTERLTADARNRQNQTKLSRSEGGMPQILDILRDVDKICREDHLRRRAERRQVANHQPCPGGGNLNGFTVASPTRRYSQLTSELVVKLPPPPVYCPTNNQHVRPTISPTQHVRPTISPTQHVRPTISPTQHVRPTISPIQHVRPTISPKQDAPIGRNAEQPPRATTQLPTSGTHQPQKSVPSSRRQVLENILRDVPT